MTTTVNVCTVLHELSVGGHELERVIAGDKERVGYSRRLIMGTKYALGLKLGWNIDEV